MNLNSSIKLKGELSIKKYNVDNNLIEELNVPNLIVTTGKAYIASRMIGTSAAVMSKMAIGSSGGSLLIGNTTLSTELARADLVATSNNAIVTYSATFGPGVGTGSIVEAGIFNASSGGTMLCRTIFPVVNKDANETIVITWNVSVG